MARAQAEPSRHPASRITTLKRRAEFLRTRHGARCATPVFVLEAKRRPDQSEAMTVARIGFTVSKKVGGAVERNRIKRRLRSAVRDVLREHARSDFDYVLIARRPALDAAYDSLVSEMVKAFGRVHAASEGPRSERRASSVQRA